jgi:putative RNA 2'-phosphotransferase
VNYQELSKEVSYALRHAPWEYELELDDDGWVGVDQLLTALRLNPKWSNVKVSDLELMISESEKKRHEIVDGRIRAFYGHSIPNKIIKSEAEPPAILYHGTTKKVLNSILQKGLKPNQRQYVHLSQDIETALQVGKRRDSEPIIFEIDAKRAHENGVNFYLGNEKVWLADVISPEYLSIVEKG